MKKPGVYTPGGVTENARVLIIEIGAYFLPINLDNFSSLADMLKLLATEFGPN